MTEKRKKNPTEPFEEELQETEENEQEQIEDNAKPRRNPRRGAKQRKTEAGKVVVPKYLWVKYGNAQPVEVSTAGCNNVSKLIKAVKKEMKPDLDSFSPSRITLHTSEDAAAVRSGLSLAQAIVDAGTGQPSGISDENPLIVKTIQPQGGTAAMQIQVTIAKLSIDLGFASNLPSVVGSFFQVDGLYYAGLSKENESKKRLYGRQDTLDLLNALNGMEKGIRISGPPGVGKSVTTWLWACHQAYVYKKTVLWLHIRKGADAKVLMISGNQASMATLGLDQLPPFVRSNQSDIVIIDGVTREPMHEICIGAVFNDASNHDRLAVSVASMATRTNEEDDESLKISKFDSLPWSYDEYLGAIADDNFFEEVESMLSGTTENAVGAQQTHDRRVELLNNKFYYAGHSARWMWATQFSCVIQKIARCLKRVKDYTGMLKGAVGEGSAESVNHLMCSYREGTFFTSHYIARKVLQRGGAEAVRLAYGIASGLNNPSFTGWVVEMDFINQVMLAKGKQLNIVGESWDVLEVIENCDMEREESLKLYSQQLQEGCWIVPKRWNQGSYDLVWIVRHNKEKKDVEKVQLIVHFIQVTKASSHKLNFSHFKNFATCLVKALECEITGIEIYIMTPENSGFSFSSSMIQSSGQLSHFNIGATSEKWEKVKEVPNVRIKSFTQTK